LQRLLSQGSKKSNQSDELLAFRSEGPQTVKNLPELDAQKFLELRDFRNISRDGIQVDGSSEDLGRSSSNKSTLESGATGPSVMVDQVNGKTSSDNNQGPPGGGDGEKSDRNTKFSD